MKAVILSAGEGTRLRPLTYSMPKPLLPVANKPVIFYGVEQIAAAGINEIVVVVGTNRVQIERAVGDGSRWGVKISYAMQLRPLGLAHALSCAEEFLKNEPFVMYLGDNLFAAGVVQKAVKAYSDKLTHTLLLLCPVKESHHFGIADLQGERVLRVVEKPETSRSNLAVVGVYVFERSIFEAIKGLSPSQRGELEITDAIQRQVENGKAVRGLRLEEWWIDTGNEQSLLEANRQILKSINPANKGEVDKKSRLTGPVNIAKGCRVENSIIAGPVSISGDCSIKDCLLGPFTSVGTGVELSNTCIEDSIVLSGARINNPAWIISGSIIGQRVEIQSLNKANKCRLFIGDDAKFLG